VPVTFASPHAQVAPAPARAAWWHGLLAIGQRWMVASEGLTEVVGHVTGPMVKHRFNGPQKPGGPVPLSQADIEAARKAMVAHFHPERGEVVVLVTGGGRETVHAAVITGVSATGDVRIEQAIAQTGREPETYPGWLGGLSRWVDTRLGNSMFRMQGVLEDDWSRYAPAARRNTALVLSLQGDPARARSALGQVRGWIGRPYDRCLLAAEPATAATDREFYCTEIVAAYLNRVRPGVVGMSVVTGYRAFQVRDLMAATTRHGGPLQVWFNAGDRLDVAGLDPFPVSQN